MGISRHPLSSNSIAARLPHVPVDAALIARLEESFRRISARSDDFTERFYRKLFEARPDLRGLFPADMTAQRKKLLDSLRMVIDNLHAPDRVRAALEELGRAHVRYGAKPEHYPTVCDLLVSAMGDAMGATWTTDLKDDWTDAIRLVSEIMLQGAASPSPRPT